MARKKSILTRVDRERDESLNGGSTTRAHSRRGQPTIQTFGGLQEKSPLVLRDTKEFIDFKFIEVEYAEYVGFERALKADPPVDVVKVDRDDLLGAGVPTDVYDRALTAFVIFSGAFKLPTDIGRFCENRSMPGFWQEGVKWHVGNTIRVQLAL